MSGLNPEGVDVYNFKAPSATEQAHDYLWRHQRSLPELGRIAVFDRSHYENVLITRVHPETLWPRTAVLDAGTSGSGGIATSTTGSATSLITGPSSSSCLNVSRANRRAAP